FLAVLVALVLIHTDELHVQAGQAREERRRQNTWQSLREGLAYVWTTPSVALVIFVVGVVLLLGANFNVVLPLFATDVLHEGATRFGFLSGAMGTGALLAALWLAWRQVKPTVPAVLIATLLFSLLEVAFALSSVYLASLALIAGVGASESIFGALAVTIMQMEAPDHLRGRVNSVYIFFFSGSVPVGYVMAGWLSALIGAPLGLLLCAVLCLATVGVGWIWWVRSRQKAPGHQ
ncbi:MAG TPA: MFS transporter, partial [Ktedonobacterales bacterium]